MMLVGLGSCHVRDNPENDEQQRTAGRETYIFERELETTTPAG